VVLALWIELLELMPVAKADKEEAVILVSAPGYDPDFLELLPFAQNKKQGRIILKDRTFVLKILSNLWMRLPLCLLLGTG